MSRADKIKRGLVVIQAGFEMVDKRRSTCFKAMSLIDEQLDEIEKLKEENNNLIKTQELNTTALYSCVVTDCMESWQESLHETKRGAWKAGNDWLNRQHNKGFKSRSLVGKDSSDFMGWHASFAVLPVKVLD